jgi:asparagine synthetase A
MVTLVKHEWHQVDSQYKFEITDEILEEIYPDLKKKERKQLLSEIVDGTFSIDQLLDDADENNVWLDWDHSYDDWWTERKGGYDVTYEVE